MPLQGQRSGVQPLCGESPPGPEMTGRRIGDGWRIFGLTPIFRVTHSRDGAERCPGCGSPSSQALSGSMTARVALMREPGE